MKLLREYIRALLTEAAKGPRDLPEDTVVSVTNTFDGFYIEYTHLQKSPGFRGPSGAVTIAGLSPEEASGTGVYKEIGPIGNCGGALIVVDSGAEKGWGPMLYDVAMEWATMHAGGLVSDRGSVSPSARKVWDYYMNNRGDVTGIQMDDLKNTLTPEEEDNCDQFVATSTSAPAFGSEESVQTNWIESPLSKRWTKEPTTINMLRSMGKLVEK